MRDRPTRLARSRASRGRLSSRGQLSLTVVEAAVATLFVLAVAAGFALTPAHPATVPVDQQATDAASLVATVPADGPGTLLGAACASPGDFDSRAERLHAAAARAIPNAAFVSLQTPEGTVGTPPPDGARTGRAPAVVPGCTATVAVWYP